MSCRRGCAFQVLFGCLRGFRFGVRTCVHGRSWRLRTDQDHFYVVDRWSRWRRRWVAMQNERVAVTKKDQVEDLR